MVNKDIHVLGTYDVFVVQFVKLYCIYIFFFIEFSKVEQVGHQGSDWPLNSHAQDVLKAKKYKS